MSNYLTFVVLMQKIGRANSQVNILATSILFVIAKYLLHKGDYIEQNYDKK